jgi:hypothetical protein
MASVVSILVSARSTTASAFSATTRQVATLGRAVNRLSLQFRQQTVQTARLAGAYQDANGQWRAANGQFITMNRAVRTHTTLLGHAVNATRRLGRLAGTAFRSMGKAALDALPGIIAMGVKIAAITSLAVAALGAIGNIIPAIMLVVPAGMAAGAALAVFKLALNGVGDALKAGLSGDTEEFEKALKKLSPAAQSAVRTMVDLRGEWTRVKAFTQEAFFTGFRDDVIKVSRALEPLARVWLPRIAAAFAAARTKVANFLALWQTKTDLEGIFRNVERAIKGVLKVAVPLLQIITDIGSVAAPRLADGAESLGEMAQKAADWVREMRNSGQLMQWLDKAIENLNILKQIGKNIGDMFTAIFKGASDEGQTFLENIEEFTRATAEWMHSADGQSWIDNAASIGAALADLAAAFNFVADVSRGMQLILDTVFKAILAMVFSWASGLLGAMAIAFGWIPGLGPKLKQAAKEFEEFRDRANAATEGIRKNFDVTIRYRTIGNTGIGLKGSEQQSTYSSGIGGRAAGGMARGLKWVGERGRELIDMSQGRVYSNATSERMAAQASGGGGSVTVLLSVAPTSGTGNQFAEMFNWALKNNHIQLTAGGQRVRLAT